MSLLVNPTVGRVAGFLNRRGLGRLTRSLKGAVRLLSRDTLTVRADGLVLQGPADSWRVLNQIRSGRLEPYEVALFRDAIRPGATVVDLGANIGYYALLASRLAGDEGRVYAFEPDPRTATSLRANVRANGAANVTVVERAASDSPGTREFFLSATASHSGLRRSMEEASIVRRATVEATTVDDVLGGAPVDVVKMDIEGEEPAALRGMARTLAASPDVCVFLELAPKALAEAGVDAAAFVDDLRARFREVLVVDERAHSLESLPPGAPAGRHNLLCRGLRSEA